MIRYDEVTKTWEVSYSKRHPETRIPCRAARKGIKSGAEAKRVYAELVVQVEGKLRKSITPTWWEMVEKFCAQSKERGLQQKTIENYFLCLRLHTSEKWGARLIDTITTLEIIDLVNECTKNRSASHKKSMAKFIRAVFNYALEAGVISRNPTPKFEYKIGDKIKKVLTENQAKFLLKKAKELDSPWFYHWCLALHLGLRSGELYALQWECVDFERKTILVNCSWNNKDGFKSTKSGDDRIVPIPESLVPILKELKLLSYDSNFVLPRLNRWTKGEQARELRMFLIGIGLPAVHFHCLRSSWATTLLAKGVEPVKVMTMGGWKDMKTMMIYIRKAGVDTAGSTDVLNLVDLNQPEAKILKMSIGSQL